MNGFTDKQVAALSAPLDRSAVKQRQQGGSKVSYVEGYHCENEANRIFGFDAWDRETVHIQCVSERERKIGKGQYEKDGWGVSYVARVRVTVRAGDSVVVREGVGAGHGIDADVGQAHESAIKEAETDAEKRALKTFGNPFGQALYDKEQREVADTPEPPVEPPALINDGEWAAITQLIEASPMSVQDICKFYKITSLKAMTVPMYRDANTRLKTEIDNAAAQKKAA